MHRVILRILWLNLMVAAAKGAYALWSGSLAVASDAVHSLLDAASNVVGLVALSLASSPPDPEHPYGHRKIEIVAAALIGVVIAGGSLQFAWSAMDRLIHGKAMTRFAMPGIVVMGITLVVNTLVARYEARRGRELGSPFLVADAAHTGSDILVTLGVLGSLVATRLGFTWADPAGALVVLAVVARVAFRILSQNLAVLVDRAAVEASVVEEVVLGVPGARGCHRVRSRSTGGVAHLDLHLLVDGELSLNRAHGISHDVEQALRERFPELVDITIHVEPEGEPVEGL